MNCKRPISIWHCTICCFKPALLLTAFFGFPLFRTTCKHAGARIISHHAFSKPTLMAAFVVLLITGWYTIKRFVNLFTEEYDVFELAVLLPNIFYSFASFVSQIYLVCSIREVPNILLLLSSAINSWHKALKISKTFCKTSTVKTFTFKHAAVYLMSLGSFAVALCFTKKFDLMEKVCWLIYLYVILMLVLTVTTLFYYMTKALEARNHHLKTFLDELETLKDCRSFRYRKHLKRILNQHVTFQSSMFITHKYCNKFVCIMVALWLVNAVMVLVATSFLVALCVKRYPSKLLDEQILCLSFLFLISAGVVINVIFKSTDLSNVNLDIQSYFYKFPTTKIDFKNALKLEMLMKSIRLQQFEFTVWYVVPFNVNMMAPFSGAVITYLLVCIQFENKFDEN